MGPVQWNSAHMGATPALEPVGGMASESTALKEQCEIEAETHTLALVLCREDTRHHLSRMRRSCGNCVPLAEAPASGDVSAGV